MRIRNRDQFDLLLHIVLTICLLIGEVNFGNQRNIRISLLTSRSSAVNLLTCRLRAQCMTWKSTFKLCSARQCVFVDIFFKRMIKQLLDSFFADNTYLKLDSIQIYLKNVIQWLFDFAYHWFVWLKHGNTRTEGSSKLSGGLKRGKLNRSSSSVGFLFWECLSPILNVTWQWLLLYVTTFWRFPFVIG